jgi:hypothetical protein
MREIGAVTDLYIRTIAESAEWDLSALDGLTFTDDYVGALASLDRGKPGMRAPVPTVTEYGSGSAMAVGVIRDGELRFRLVMHVSDLLHLFETDDAVVRKGLYTLAHELAHVDISAQFYRSFPDAFGAPPRCGQRYPPLFLTAFRMWDEYAASRYSAGFRPEQKEEYEQVLRSTVLACSNRVKHALATFDKHRQHMVALKDIHDACAEVLTAGSYFMGHLVGVGVATGNIEEHVHAVVENATWRSLLSETLASLEQLWIAAEWQSEEVFAPTAEIVRKAIAMQGVAVGWRDGEVQAAPVRSPMLALRLNLELDQLVDVSQV